MGSVWVKEFRHDSAKLWPMIGPIVTSREAHKALGGGMFSDSSTTWFVARDNAGAVLGCCSVRETPKGYWLENSWVCPEARGKGVHKALCQARDEWLDKAPAKDRLACVKESRWKYYKANGWEVASQRGSWIYGVKHVKK